MIQSARNALLLRLFLNACQFWVNHNATAVFANDDFLVHLDFHLALRWNAVEAAAASVTLNVYDTQAVACALADAFESGEQARVDFSFEFLGFFANALFVLLGFRYNFIEFALLFTEDVLTVSKSFVCSNNVLCLLFRLGREFADTLFGKFNFEVLELYFL